MNIQNKSIYGLRYLKHQLYWKAILTSAKFHDRKDILEIAHSLRNFYYAHWIGGFNTTKIKQPSFRLLQLINKEKADLSKIQNELEKTSSENNVLTRIKQAITENAYNQAWLKPLLLSLEYSQVDITLNFIPITSDVHIEHVLPVQYIKYDEWKNLFTDEQAKVYLNILPNLTLLSGKKNIEASNSPFTNKIDIYNGKGKDGLVAYRTTQWISDNVKQGDKEWDRQTLEKRFNWYLKEINKEFDWDLNSLIFEHFENDIEEIVEETDDEDDSDEVRKISKVRFHKECVAAYSMKTSRSFEKVERNTYRDTSNDSLIICKISKEHDKYADPSFWYGLDPKELQVLKSNKANSLILGCGTEENIIALPVAFVEKYLPMMVRSGERHWHINIYEQEGQLRLSLKDGDLVDISGFQV